MVEGAIDLIDVEDRVGFEDGERRFLFFASDRVRLGLGDLGEEDDALPPGTRFDMVRSFLDATAHISPLVERCPVFAGVAVITGDSEFISRALDCLREFMDADGQAFVYQRFIAPTSGSVRFAKALDRSVTGSINELVKFATFWLAEDDIAPQEVGFRLNDILLSAIARSKSDGYGKPKEAFTSLMEDLELPGGDSIGHGMQQDN
jgi:hypothetical protein